jgi:hypothetical protein
MNVLALVPYPIEDACTRYRIGPVHARAPGCRCPRHARADPRAGRIRAPVPAGGIVRKSLDWLSAVDRRRAQIDSARSYDAVFLLRDLWPLRGPDFERRLFERTPHVVFDFDDAIFCHM